jgi:hypothetical protein
MPIPRELLDAMEAARVREAAEADRDRRRDFFRTALECLAWCALGLLGMGWGLHTTDELLGRGVFYAGAGVGNAGVIFALLGWYRRGERRGDW